MKNKILSILLSLYLSLGFSGCATYQPMVQPTTFLVSKKLIDKNPKNIAKLVIVADGLELLSKGLNRSLILRDFTDITSKAGKEPEWAVLAQYIYDIYKENVRPSDNYTKAAKDLLSISKGIRDAVAISTPAK